MPEMPNRAAFERDLTEAISTVLSAARRDLVNAVHREGFRQGDLAHVPADILQHLEHDLLRSLQPALTTAYVETANQFAGILSFGIDQARLQDLADTWSKQIIPGLVSGMMDSTRRSLRDMAGRAPDVPLDKRALLALLGAGVLFGISRAMALSRTLATQVNSAAENGINTELRGGGATIEERWYTKKDEFVCPICRPLHGKLRGDGWTDEPPAHPNCRCERKYTITAPDGTRTIVRASEENGPPVSR